MRIFAWTLIPITANIELLRHGAVQRIAVLKAVDWEREIDRRYVEQADILEV